MDKRRRTVGAGLVPEYAGTRKSRWIALIVIGNLRFTTCVIAVNCSDMEDECDRKS